MITCGRDNSISVYDLATNKATRVKVADNITSLVTLNDSLGVLTVDEACMVMVYDTTDLSVTKTIGFLKGAISCATGPMGVAIGCQDQIVIIDNDSETKL